MIIPSDKKLPIARKIFSSLGKSLQGYQEKYIMDEHKRIIRNKGRGVGCSFDGSYKKLVKAYEKKGEYIMVAQDKPSSEHLLQYVYDFHMAFQESPFGEINDFPQLVSRSKDVMEFSNGSRIYSKPGEPRAIRHLHGDVFWDETAATENDAEMRAAINGCLRPNFDLDMTSTPMEQTGVFYDTWKMANEQKGKNDYWAIYELPYTCCNIPEYIQAVERDKLQAIEEGWYDDWRREYCCNFVDGSTRLFTMELIKEHLEKIVLSVPVHFAGADFGKVIDQGVYVEAGKDEQGLIRFPKIIDFNLKEDYSFQIDVIRGNIKSHKDFERFYPDATGVGVKLVEDLQKTDIAQYVEAITFTNQIKEKMAMFFYTALLQSKILIPNNPKLIKQMHGIKRTKTEDGRNRYKHDPGKHDDVFWACALSLMGYIDEKAMGNANDIVLSGQQSSNITRNRLNELKNEIGRIR